MDKELTGWPVQRVIKQKQSKQKPVMSGVPQGSILEPILFNIFINDTNSGIVCSLSTFADDTKFSDSVELLEERDAVQSDLDRLEEWACVNLMISNMAKDRVLHLNQGNPLKAPSSPNHYMIL